MRALAAALVLSLPAWAQYDLLLKGGHVVDARNGIEGVRDVAIKDGKIAAVAPAIDAKTAAKVVAVNGLYVVPGLVDIHTHLYTTTGIPEVWAGDNSVRPDDFSFRTGVTTMVDAGSSGWRNFEHFKFTVIDRAQTRVLAMINIAGFGMMTDVVENDETELLAERVAALARKHADVVVGVKTAHYRKPGWTSVERAVEAGELARIPVMVDFGWFVRERPFWQLVTEKLRPGDIATHMFRGPVPVADDGGKLYAYLEEARKRGVKFDVGHGGGSFVFRNAVPAMKHGFLPDSISTDLHTGSMNASMMDMPTTMSKFLAMGMPLAEVIKRSTWMPANVINRPELGHLTVGATADIAVLRAMTGDFGFQDSAGGGLRGKRRIVAELTIRAGNIVWNQNAAGVPDYRTLPRDYGIREGEFIVPPPVRSSRP